MRLKVKLTVGGNEHIGFTPSLLDVDTGSGTDFSAPWWAECSSVWHDVHCDYAYAYSYTYTFIRYSITGVVGVAERLGVCGSCVCVP